MQLSIGDIRVKKLSLENAEKDGVTSWPIWTKEIATFDWTYESKETCYITEGEVHVEAGGETLTLGEGDYVVFPKGLNCLWRIKSQVKKHYQFS